MTEIQIILAVAAIVTLGGGIPVYFFFRRLKQQQKITQAGHNMQHVISATEQKIADAVEAASQRQATALSEALEELRKIRVEVEWLSGERMIDQAISMARDGVDPIGISRETGLSLDDAATISRFRRH